MGSPEVTPIPPFVSQHLHVHSHAEIQEIMQSPDFVQGRSPERDVFFGGSLVMLDGDEHIQRKKEFASLFSKGAMVFYETQLLEPVIAQAMAELRAKRGPDGLARTDLVPLVRTMLHRISAQVTGVDGIDTPARTERFRHLIAALADAASGQWSIRSREELFEEGLRARQTLVDEFLLPSLNRRRQLVKRFRSGQIDKENLP